jgi:hypothetical protein
VGTPDVALLTSFADAKLIPLAPTFLLVRIDHACSIADIPTIRSA